MILPIDRRTLLEGSTAGAALALLGGRARATTGLVPGAGQAFSFDLLVEKARALAARAYVSRAVPAEAAAIDYAAHGRIKPRPTREWAGGRGTVPVAFFHVGGDFRTPVAMHVVEAGRSRPILSSPALFDMPADSPARTLSADASFAGLRLFDATGARPQAWVAFLGGADFRAVGDPGCFRVSASGLALDVAGQGPEEMPSFTEFYLEPGAGSALTIYALLDSPSVAGAYRFALTRSGAVAMDVEARLFVRRELERFGVAPCRSIFFETGDADDRRSCSDSDLLSIASGSGEFLWRPLRNPALTTVSSFPADRPRGFGLLKRSGDEPNGGSRPSLWIEPLGDWGQGAVQLIEAPAVDDFRDNVAAMWVPRRSPRAGDTLTYRYRLDWAAGMGEREPPAADCAATS